MSVTPVLRSAKREERLDVEIEGDATEVNYVREYWKRVSAKKRTFTSVSFKFTVFGSCYFHNCTFVDCEFRGTSFTDVSLRSSTFEGCSFQYARFTRSFVPYDVLDRNLPSEENLQMFLAQILRANYAQVGDTNGVNKAIDVELRATRVHLYKAAYSRDSYYRRKHKGPARLRAGVGHSWFVARHWLWGNGESLGRVVLSLCLATFGIGLTLAGSGVPVNEALGAAFPLFLGIMPRGMMAPTWLLVTANAVRLVLVGLFLSVLIRRMARR